MKLLVFFPSFDRGGCEEYSLSLAIKALEIGWRVEVCFPQTSRTRSLRTDFEQRNISCHNWQPESYSGMGSWGTYSSQIEEANLRLAYIKPDAVLAALPWPDSALGFIVVCGTRMIPTLVVFQNCSETVEVDKSIVDDCNLARRRKQTWVAVSQHNRHHIAATFKMPIADIRVIFNGVNSSSNCLFQTEMEREAVRFGLREELRLPQSALIGLTVARLVQEKGYLELLTVAPVIAKRFPGVYFLWAGMGIRKDEARFLEMVQEANLQNRVLLLGFRSDIKRLLCSADLFVFPSHQEGMSFALIEAMTHGCPIVASDRTSIPECIRHGKEGLLFPIENVDRFTDILAFALRYPKTMNKLANKARSKAKLFTAERMYSATFSALVELTGGIVTTTETGDSPIPLSR